MTASTNSIRRIFQRVLQAERKMICQYNDYKTYLQSTPRWSSPAVERNYNRIKGRFSFVARLVRLRLKIGTDNDTDKEDEGFEEMNTAEENIRKSSNDVLEDSSWLISMIRNAISLIRGRSRLQFRGSLPLQSTRVNRGRPRNRAQARRAEAHLMPDFLDDEGFQSDAEQ